MELCSLCKATFAQHNVSDTYHFLLLFIPILFLTTVVLYDFSFIYLVNEHLGYFQSFCLLLVQLLWIFAYVFLWIQLVLIICSIYVL